MKNAPSDNFEISAFIIGADKLFGNNGKVTFTSRSITIDRKNNKQDLDFQHVRSFGKVKYPGSFVTYTYIQDHGCNIFYFSMPEPDCFLQNLESKIGTNKMHHRIKSSLTDQIMMFSILFLLFLSLPMSIITIQESMLTLPMVIGINLAIHYFFCCIIIAQVYFSDRTKMIPNKVAFVSLLTPVLGPILLFHYRQRFILPYAKAVNS